MEKIDLDQRVMEYLETTTEDSKIYCMCRLYNDYYDYRNHLVKDLVYKKDSKIKFSLVKVRAGIEKIKDAINELEDEIIAEKILLQFSLLKNDFEKLDKTDPKSIRQVLSRLTRLESLMQLPITYPEVLEYCIESELKQIKGGLKIR